VSDLLENAAVHTVHDYRGERPSVLDEVVEDQVQAVFGSTRKVLSRPLVEVDDAKGWRNSSGEVVTGRLQTVTQ